MTSWHKKQHKTESIPRKRDVPLIKKEILKHAAEDEFKEEIEEYLIGTDTRRTKRKISSKSR